MKTISLHAILMYLIMGTAFGQVETFEDEITGAATFTVGTGGMSFTTTGDLFVEIYPNRNYGCDGSETYLGTGITNGPSSGYVGSIKVTTPGDKFTVSTVSSWCTFTSATGGFNQRGGDIKLTGILSNGGTIEETFTNVPDPNDNGYGQTAFSPGIWGNKELVELKVELVSSILNYVAFDNIEFANLIATSISDIQQEKVNIYPNPTAGEIEISGIDDFGLEVKIVDTFGRIIKEPSVSNQKIDISGLPGGVYFIAISSDDQLFTRRIVKY